MTFEDWATQLGFTQEVRAWLHSSPPSDEARRMLDELKVEAKRRYRSLARRLHPDLGGDEEEFKLLNDVMGVVEGLMIPDDPPPEPEPLPMPVTVFGNWIRLG